jgi:hypothetical protein
MQGCIICFNGPYLKYKKCLKNRLKNLGVMYMLSVISGVLINIKDLKELKNKEDNWRNKN